MYQDNRRLDFHALGREIKRKREANGWTQEYHAQLVDRTPRSIMYFENRGQHPSLNAFYKNVTGIFVGVPGDALTASRASVATLAIFASRRAAKTLVGEPPQTRLWDSSAQTPLCCFGTKCPKAETPGNSKKLFPGRLENVESIWQYLYRTYNHITPSKNEAGNHCKQGVFPGQMFTHQPCFLKYFWQQKTQLIPRQ